MGVSELVIRFVVARAREEMKKPNDGRSFDVLKTCVCVKMSEDGIRLD
jgi:hypothetical protein